MTKALYAGTFDPITSGHTDIIDRSLLLFDHLTVAIAQSRSKNTLFSVEERVDMVEHLYRDNPKISVISYSRKLTVDLMAEQHADVMIRGLRGVADFEYELQLANMNRSMWPDYESIFLTPRDGLAYISSTLVREIASMGGEISDFVDPFVATKLQEKFS